jgi:hypothetical protein
MRILKSDYESRVLLEIFGYSNVKEVRVYGTAYKSYKRIFRNFGSEFCKSIKMNENNE